MPLHNTATAYGALAKTFHWLAVLLIAFQLASGPLMVRMPDGSIVLGLNGSEWFNWHKTVGLLALALTVPRLLLRQWGGLPDWSPRLSDAERRLAHALEQGLYLSMIVVPLTGYLYVTAGGYGVRFAGLWPLPAPFGPHEGLATAMRAIHVGGAIVFVGLLAGHLGLVLRHAPRAADGLLRRMMPRRNEALKLAQDRNRVR